MLNPQIRAILRMLADKEDLSKEDFLMVCLGYIIGASQTENGLDYIKHQIQANPERALTYSVFAHNILAIVNAEEGKPNVQSH